MNKKHNIILLFFIVSSVLGVISQAQQATPTRQAAASSLVEAKEEFSGNISLNLKIYMDGEIQESIAFQLINKNTNFTVKHIGIDEGKRGPLEFSGEIQVIGDQTYFLAYDLSEVIKVTTGNSTEYRNSGLSAKIEIEKNIEEVLMKNNGTVYTLEIGESLNKSE